MTDQPYTEDDLRTEAARQLAALTEDPDLMGIGERMEGQEVTPGGEVDWDDFRNETFEAAQRSVHALIVGATDLSEWAVHLGADGLEPSKQRLEFGDDVRVRIHFAFTPDVSEADRRDLVASIAAHMIAGT